MNTAPASPLRVLEHKAVTRGMQGNRGLGFQRRSNTVLAAGTLSLPQTGVAGLVGINGAGKSTIMLEIADLLMHPGGPTQRLLWRRHERTFEGSVAYSPQRPSFPAWLSGSEIAAMFGFEYDELEAAYPALLLDELRRARGSALSVGQTQAISVVLALHAGADITLLDEPFAPLDFRRRIALSEILRSRSASQDGLVLVSSQSAAELLDVCTWLVVLRGGRYAFSGAIRDVVGDADGEAARSRLEDHVMALL